MAGIQELLVQCPGCGLIRPLNQRGATQVCIHCDYPIPTAGLDAPQAQTAVRQAVQTQRLIEQAEAIARSARFAVRALIALLVVTVLAALFGCGPDAAGPPPPSAEPVASETTPVAEASQDESPIVRVRPEEKPIPEVPDLPVVIVGMLDDALEGEGTIAHGGDSWSLTIPEDLGWIHAQTRGDRVFEISVILPVVSAKTDDQLDRQMRVARKVIDAVLQVSPEDQAEAQRWFIRALRAKREHSAELAVREFPYVRLEVHTVKELGTLYLHVRPPPSRISW